MSETKKMTLTEETDALEYKLNHIKKCIKREASDLHDSACVQLEEHGKESIDNILSRFVGMENSMIRARREMGEMRYLLGVLQYMEEMKGTK